jgi:hypothetical protein
VKIGDRFVLRHLGDEVVFTRHIAPGRVEVAFWPRCTTHLIVNPDKSLIQIAQREAS